MYSGSDADHGWQTIVGHRPSRDDTRLIGKLRHPEIMTEHGDSIKLGSRLAMM